MKIMNKLVNVFWGKVASHICDNLMITEIIDILKNYEKIQVLDNTMERNVIDLPNGDMFAVKNKAGDTIEIYYKNLRFHLVDNGKEDIFQIYLKRDKDTWNIVKRNNVFDITNPDTDSVEVYYWFDIETMHGFRCSHEQYNSGYWNEYVAKTVNEFDDFVHDITVERKISNAYKNFKTE